MSPHNKPWHRNHTHGRTTNVRPRLRVLILCEDEKSSCLYFKGFRLDSRRVEVQAVGTGRNTDSLVEDAIRRKKDAKDTGEPFNRVWCVFDRDNFPEQNFNHAFQLADSNGIDVAWTNEAFELWYLLHFNYHDTGIGRSEFPRRVSKLIGKRYEKHDDSIYQQIEPNQSQAIKHARRLEKHWVEMGEYNPASKNPSTSVHKLVEFLKEFEDLGSADSE